METLFDLHAQYRLSSYLERIGEVLGSSSRRSSFAIYAMGLLGDGARKSMEPIAARACADPSRADAVHQQLQHFLANSEWGDRDVRREASLYAIRAMVAEGPIETWQIDDTGFLKQGSHSVGVQRQYTGTAGKLTNCQLGVSLSVATRSEQVPIDMELYLPTSWTENAARRREAHIPEEVTFASKNQLALEMMRRAIADGIPPGIVLADSFYGDKALFRDGVRALGLDYAVGVHSDNRVWRIDSLGRRNGKPRTVKDLALALSRHDFRKVTWRQGAKTLLCGRFALCRVKPALCNEDSTALREREEVWLVIEWPDDEAEPTKYFFTTLPTSSSKRRVIHIIKERWRTEQVYENLKGQLGLDHFEGRSFPGWHHHVSVALCCYAFVVAERARRFFSPRGRPQVHRPLEITP